MRLFIKFIAAFILIEFLDIVTDFNTPINIVTSALVVAAAEDLFEQIKGGSN